MFEACGVRVRVDEARRPQAGPGPLRRLLEHLDKRTQRAGKRFVLVHEHLVPDADGLHARRKLDQGPALERRRRGEPRQKRHADAALSQTHQRLGSSCLHHRVQLLVSLGEQDMRGTIRRLDTCCHEALDELDW